MKKSLSKGCWECGRDDQRCRPAYIDSKGEVYWVCSQCWNDLKYDDYAVEHPQPRKERDWVQ